MQLPGADRIPSWLLLGMCIWHIVAVPMCVLYLIGKPVSMSLAPLIRTAESRDFLLELKARDSLSPGEFYDRFYADTDVPRQIVLRVRDLLEFQLEDYDAVSRLAPKDNICLLDDELDPVEILLELEGELGITMYPETVDGTVDSLIRAVANIQKGSGSSS